MRQPSQAKPNVLVRVKKKYTNDECKCNGVQYTSTIDKRAHINEVTLKPTQLSSNATIVATTVASVAKTVAAIIFPSQISKIIKILSALDELFNNCMQLRQNKME